MVKESSVAGGDFPVTKIILSKSELEYLYSAGGEFDAETGKPIMYISDELYAIYSDEWFSKNSLILIVIEEPSGSINVGIEGVSNAAGGSVTVVITEDIPEIGTDDMAYWLLFVEVNGEIISKDTAVEIDAIWSPSAVLLPALGEDVIIFERCYWLNVSNDSGFSEKVYTKGEYYGEISFVTSERISSLETDGVSSVLPVGTKIYKCKEYGDILLADVDGVLIPYLCIVEG